MMGIDVFQWLTGGKQPPERKRKRRLPAVSPKRARPVLKEPDVETEPAPVDEIVFEGSSHSFGSELTFILDSPTDRRCSSVGNAEQWPGEANKNEKIEKEQDEIVDVEHILDGVQNFLDGSHRFKGEDDRLNRYMEETVNSSSDSLDLETFMEQLSRGKDVSKSTPPLHIINLKCASNEENKSQCTILLDLDLDVDLISTSDPVPKRIVTTQQQRMEEPKPEKLNSPLSALMSLLEEQWPVEAPKTEELRPPLPLPKVKVLRPSAAPTPENCLAREKRPRPCPFPVGLIVL
jgi:hypothetical protein